MMTSLVRTQLVRITYKAKIKTAPFSWDGPIKVYKSDLHFPDALHIIVLPKGRIRMY